MDMDDALEMRTMTMGSSCPDNNNSRPSNTTILHKIDLKVIGMMCQRNCGTTVENALKELPMVKQAYAVFREQRAYVEFETQQQQQQQQQTYQESLKLAMEAIEDVGFDVEEIVDLQAHLHTLMLTDESSTGSDDAMESITATTTKYNVDKLDQVNNNKRFGGGASFNAPLQFLVGGMSCAVCTGRVEAALQNIPGVASAWVLLATSQAMVNVQDGYSENTIQQECIRAVQTAGYDCQAMASSGALHESAQQVEQERLKELRMWLRLFLTALVLTTPLVVMTHSKMGKTIPFRNLQMAVLSMCVQFGVGWRFYKAAYKSWKAGSIGMDFLVVLGTTASLVYSLFVWATGSQVMPTFATGAMLLTFVTLGKYLEAFARGKTADALHALMDLQPRTALKVVDRKLSSTNLMSLETVEVALEDVGVGDHLKVLPGARVPTDSVIVAIADGSTGDCEYDGSEDQTKQPCAYIDEAAISGEPFPVAKSIGDSVIGSTVNQMSCLVIKVTATGSSTVLSKIVRLMEDAQRNKAPIQAHADYIAGIFAPVVIGISFLTLCGWLIFNQVSTEERIFAAVMSAISVIVVACPCALGLATPTAVMVGTGVGAQNGVLIKGGYALESLHSINTVIFDKTGTITTGKAILGEMVSLVDEDGGLDALIQHHPSVVRVENVALWLAACAEAQSEHPLARAIINAAKKEWGGDVTRSQDGVKVTRFRMVPGQGVECHVALQDWGSRCVRVGSREWTSDNTSEQDFSISNTQENVATELRSHGQVVVYVSVSDTKLNVYRTIAVLGILDPIHADAAKTVAVLRGIGMDVWLCTGDHEVTAKAVAAQVGIDLENVCASISPEGKADLVTRLQSSSFCSKRRRSIPRVAVVGDGINDAIALCRAGKLDQVAISTLYVSSYY
jgi:Cu+-exporting ATPase